MRLAVSILPMLSYPRQPMPLTARFGKSGYGADVDCAAAPRRDSAPRSSLQGKV